MMEKTDSTISDRDLKKLSYEYAGECDGIDYFRTPGSSTLARGDLSDLDELVEVQRRHPMIDARTAQAALTLRENARQITPFGTVATDEVAS
jgi:hypothetical protein